MERSDQIGELIAALAKAQGEYGVVLKDNEAKVKGTTKAGKEYDYGYKYADLASVIAAVRPALSKHGIAFVQLNSADLQRQTAAVTTYLHCGEQFISESVEAPAIGQTGFHVQSIGAIRTYLRRYSLQSICGLASEDDDAQTAVVNNAPIPQRKTEPVPQGKSTVQPPPAKPQGPFELIPANGLAPDQVKGVLIHARQGTTRDGSREILTVKFNGDIPLNQEEVTASATCFDKDLFPALMSGLNKVVHLYYKVDAGQKYISITDINTIDGVEHIDGVPVTGGAK